MVKSSTDCISHVAAFNTARSIGPPACIHSRHDLPRRLGIRHVQRIGGQAALRRQGCELVPGSCRQRHMRHASLKTPRKSRPDAGAGARDPDAAPAL